MYKKGCNLKEEIMVSAVNIADTFLFANVFEWRINK